MSFAVGSLVRARGREWVVLPGSETDLLMVRPLGGTEDEVTGLLLPLEPVESAQFELPDPAQLGDYRSCRLLRDAVRLSFRSSAGPFRSFARLAVEPRPYQLVPLMLALKLDPVRMLIADDVGIGKTIEASLIARELLDRGEIERLAVLCSPQLATQWQGELRDKFHIDAEVVLPGTATRLERNCRLNESLFERYPFVIVSTDFIKSERRRAEFQRTCPEFVIVDEAHTCAYGWEGRGGRHQRYELLKAIAANQDRHLVLVTATPHSGNETAFRSLLTLLNPEFANLPEELMGAANEPHRRRLSAHFIQRKRRDIRDYLGADTRFPDRKEMELGYKLSKEYKQLFDRVLHYAREIVSDENNQDHRQRVRWWSVLALLRSLASSPAAAAATLRTRAASADAITLAEADAIGRRTVLDLTDDESVESADLTHGSDLGDETEEEKKNHRRLLDMAREADALLGAKDQKLQHVIEIVRDLIKEGFHPILFCRFIPTAEYVAEELRKKLRGVEVVAVTGKQPSDEREERVNQLAQSPQRVLVCTDCLSEGVNLQDHFDTVIHYDLSWNPTRHEQREGRVDRYGQEKDEVRMVTYYGLDNQIDGIVLSVLISKHKKIRSSLGISVPVPVNTDQVIEAIFEGLLLRGKKGTPEEQMLLFEDFMKPKREELYGKWDEARLREEKLSQTMFSHRPIKVEEVSRELDAVRAAIGAGVDVATFTKQALTAYKAAVTENNHEVRFDIAESPRALKEVIGLGRNQFTARFELPVKDGQLYLNRTHPIVEEVAAHVRDTALDPLSDSIAHRCGVIRTRQVNRRTTLLLLRLRYHIITKRGEEQIPLLAEDAQLVAFEGAPASATWLDAETAERILALQPDANVLPDQATTFLQRVLDEFALLQPHLQQVAEERGAELLEAHRRVRTAAHLKGVSYEVKTETPDVLGIYVYLPVVQ